MTLDKAVIDASHVFTAGQLGVGVSRVRSAASLRVTGFLRSKCRQHPGEVIDFDNWKGPHISDDLSCCNSTGVYSITHVLVITICYL